MGLRSVARSLISQAQLIVGGDRYLSLLSPTNQQQLNWMQPISDSIDQSSSNNALDMQELFEQLNSK
jgi:precorrin-6B methylase 1